MLLRNVFAKSLWDARRSLPGWIVAIVAVALMYAAFWPSMRVRPRGSSTESSA